MCRSNDISTISHHERIKSTLKKEPDIQEVTHVLKGLNKKTSQRVFVENGRCLVQALTAIGHATTVNGRVDDGVGIVSFGPRTLSLSPDRPLLGLRRYFGWIFLMLCNDCA